MYTYITLSALFNAIVSTILGIFLLWQNINNRINRHLSYFCLSVAAWSYPYIGWTIASDAPNALLWFQVEHIGAAFTVITYFHFVVIWLNISSPNIKKILRVGYVFAVFFIGAVFSKYFIVDVVPKYSMRFYLNPGILYHLFLVYFFYFALYSTYLLIKHFIKASGIKRNQIKLILIGIPLSFIGGSTNYFLCYDINIPPFGNILASSYVIATVYAIANYRLMDIRLAISNAAIFVIVYALVLGGPFYLYAIGFKFYALIVAIALASVGPYIYSYIQRRAEQKLFEDQIAYQETLKTLSRGLSNVQTVGPLTQLICSSLKDAMHLTHAAVFVFRPDDQTYFLEKIIGLDHTIYRREIKSDSALAALLKKQGAPLLAEEAYSRQPDLKEEAEDLSAEVFVPLVHGDRLVGLIVLGKKKNGTIFSDRDLDAFNFFAIQATMAIELCEFIRATTEKIQEEGAAARRESLDMMMSTMAHEIANPIAAVIASADLMNQFIGRVRDHIPSEVRAQIDQAAKQIEKDAFRVADIVRSLESYSKGGEGRLEKMNVVDVLPEFHTLLFLMQKKFPGVSYIEDIATGLPAVMAEKVLIEEVLMNMAENAFHAVSRNAGEKRVVLRIYPVEGKYVRIEMQDNGYGIDQKILKQMFEVPTTTKGSVEGTGLGCYRIRQICVILNAKCHVKSDGIDKGAIVFVDIPGAG